MLADIYGVIAARLLEVDGLQVAPALTSDVPALPSARVWLTTDNFVTDKPGIIRETTWIVSLAVGHEDEPGESHVATLDFIDAIRAKFSDWRPPTLVGINGAFSAPSVVLTGYADHESTEYRITLRLRVIPDTFAVIP